MAQAPRQSADAKAQAALEILNAVAPTAARAEQVSAIRTGLADRHFLVVSRAATLAGDKLLHELIPDLVESFPRFATDPIKRDPRCKAKGAIARALVALDSHDTGFYQAGIEYRQLEPVWGGRADTATEVRCGAARPCIAPNRHSSGC